MEKSNYFVLFSESVLNTHRVPDTKNETYSTYALTFPVKPSRNNGEICFAANLLENEVYIKAISDYKNAIKERNSGKNVFILVGFDGDLAGETMSEALRENLIKSGVQKSQIIRTPLTERGYRVIKNFSDSDALDEYKELRMFQEDVRQILRQNNIKKNVGFSKIISLKNIAGRKGKVFSLDSDTSLNLNGTSLATMATKFTTGEE